MINQKNNNNSLKGYQEKIESITKSSTFCVLPWIHVATRPNGDARLCCGSNASQATKGILDAGLVKKENGEPANFGKESLMSAFNNKYMRDVRLTMLDNKIPSSCSKCFEEEASGIMSKRTWETIYWDQNGVDLEQLVQDTNQEGFVPNVIQYLDLRLGHTCNLKCVMCTPHDSSRWVQDNKKIIQISKSPLILKELNWNAEDFDNTWYERPELWEEIFQQIPNIKQLYFAGGEPLMIKEHTKFLEEIVRRGYASNITVRYNSNGIFVDDYIINLWSKFKEVRFAFSIDALNERNTYIRYPSDWNKIVENLHKLDNTPDNIKIGIACAVQIFNVQHIIDFTKWKIKQNFKKINKFMTDKHISGGGLLNMHMLYIPTYLSARILPRYLKEKLRQDFMEFKQWLYENYTQDDSFWHENPNGWKRWEGILNFVEAEDHSHLIPDFLEYTQNLDKIRNTNYKEIFPELSEL